jgi:hypothetical protein
MLAAGKLTAGWLLLVAAGPAGESTSGSEFAPILFGLALLVLGAKLGGFLAERWGQPSVLGELVFGIVLANLPPLLGGSSGIEFVRSDPTLRFLAEVGVLILLFDVGLETDLRACRQTDFDNGASYPGRRSSATNYAARPASLERPRIRGQTKPLIRETVK